MTQDERPMPEDGPAREDRPPSGRISEDWAATILGLALIILAMVGVITKAMVP